MPNLNNPQRDVNEISSYPAGAIPVTASAVGTTAATVATLPAVAGKTTYIVGFSIRAVATAAVAGNAVVSGTVTGSLNFTQFSQAVATGLVPVEEFFGYPIPASAPNTTIVVTSAAPGVGGVISVTVWGYQL